MRRLMIILLATLGLGIAPATFAAETSTPTAITANTVQMDLNRVSADDLAHLPGLGQVKSEAIIAYRQQHGPFSSVEQLLEVKGIGPAILNKIRPSLTVSGN